MREYTASDKKKHFRLHYFYFLKEDSHDKITVYE
jgi:hypothetical protein